ncbi:AAA family ATPase [Paenibacillus sp. FSL E2-0190]|jgi:predicted ATP-binding protein involved in virulence|uniref:AAA family ATPase n=1 Tax=Paenibacillus sp. FSL E2-0190 TaxID=2954504 RepID=UPI0030EB6B52
MLSRIKIVNLFGYLKHDIDFNSVVENVVILHGPNGTGKTTIFKILESISNKEFDIFFNIPFDKLIVYFEDGSSLEIINERSKFITFISSNSEHEPYQFQKRKISRRYIDTDNLDINIFNILTNMGAHRVGNYTFEYKRRRYHYLDLCEVLGINLENLGINKERKELPKWLQQTIKKLNVFYIDAERLITKNDSNNNIRKVNNYREKLMNIIANYETLYAVRSKELDATFPKRIIKIEKEKPVLGIDKYDIVNNLKVLSLIRNDISRRGILSDKTADEILTVDEFKVDDIMDSDGLKQSLYTYIKDNFEKFSVMDELLNQINLFEKIVNDFFHGKKLEVIRSQGYVIESTIGTLTGKEIPPIMLSSGEQHFLVLFFELIFNAKNKQLVLIDEPEISLHVSWQVNMVDRLIEISNLNNNKFVLATHSPSILRNHRDCVIPTGYDEDGNNE